MSASNLSSITDIFVGATDNGTSVSIPISSLESYSTGDDGKELCMSLLLAVNKALAGSDLTKMTTSTGQVATDADTLTKTFSFTAQLSYSFGNLDIEAEPTTTTTSSP